MRHITGLATRVLALSLILAVVPAVGQPSDRFRTPWGDPDLQGVWSYATLTPLERSADLEGRTFYTPEEEAAYTELRKTDRPDRPGVDPGGYNALWWDGGWVLPDHRTSQIVDPPTGRLPLNAMGQGRIAARREDRLAHPADSWLDRTNWDRCLTYHGVPPVGTNYNNSYHILQTPDVVAIHVENIHDVRIIPISRRPRLDSRIRQWNGDSRARWDGDTLVVETQNYSEKTQLRFLSTPNTKAVERFTRAGSDRIDYQFTIEDDEIYTQPWIVERPMARLEDYIVYEYACHEGNYAMTNILAGERVREQSVVGGGAR
ncbi:MAG: hypothetical protein CL484_12985 [Acidobacteria bacterium]|nr:hypothetical protein [Acidobacteriota bacterium]